MHLLSCIVFRSHIVTESVEKLLKSPLCLSYLSSYKHIVTEKSTNTSPLPLQFSSSEPFHQSVCQLQPLANQVEVYYTYQQLSAI